jgi:hypothetical protein
VTKRCKPKAAEYKRLQWNWVDCLDAYTRNAIETQREQLWYAGVRSEPTLTRMAFEYAFVIMKAKLA